MTEPVRSIAFYLPQYHPIPENDAWWGTGFTEWTNVAKAQPLFRSHYQPHIPGDLGFYDLRVPETREAQAQMARKYGIEGFCYYHYWFAGRRLLERPFNEVLESGKPDFPFCLCWANQTWTGIWHGAPGRILVEQTYPGEEDYKAHFEALLPAFLDHRYIRVAGKPLFVVYQPMNLVGGTRFVQIWNEAARAAGLEGLYFVGVNHNDGWRPVHHGFQAAILQKLPPKTPNVRWNHPMLKLAQLRHKFQLTIHDYATVFPRFTRREPAPYVEFPCAIPNWDNTPRSGLNGLIIGGSTPELFAKHFQGCLQVARRLPEDQQIVFIKSWNEWAEGNHLEPDLRYGHRYLQALLPHRTDISSQ